MKRDRAVILVSGGMDSAVTAAIAARDYNLSFLHLNYGQRTQAKEQQCFYDLAARLGVNSKLVVDVGFLKQIGGSSLTDEKIAVSRADLNRDGIPASYVPFRNANLLSIAVSWAEVVGAAKIFIGAVEEDSSGYPDCRKEFYEAFDRVIEVGTKPDTQIQIVTPVIDLKKHQIVSRGVELAVPFELTWSCYQAEDLACGICDSCALRLKGFEQAGVTDPISYKQRPSYI
jgi:7-cyano-7-deazaguanine synthase